MRIKINNQKEFDSLPDSFEDHTIIEIHGQGIIVTEHRKNSYVEAWGESSVIVRGTSHIYALWKSSIEARDRSYVTAWGESSIVARDSSRVAAWGESSVVARGDSSVEAQGNSNVLAWEKASVEAWGNSSIEAWGNSCIKNYSGSSKIKQLRQESVLINIGVENTCMTKDETATIINKGIAKHNIESFCRIYKLPIIDGSITLYKPANKNIMEFRTNSIKHKGVVKCTNFDPDVNRGFGRGLHLYPTPELAFLYNKGVLLKCRVRLEDIVVHPYNIDEVRCREVKVIGKFNNGDKNEFN